MKRYFPIILIACLMSACEESTDTPCDTPSIEFALANKVVTVQPQYAPLESEFDIEYGASGFTQGSGTTLSFSGQSTSFTVDAIGSYDVYIRAKCSDGNTSEWSSKFTVNVDGSTSSCAAPYGLDFSFSYSPPRLQWYPMSSSNFFDVEYGPSGFTIGNGTQVRTNFDYFNEAIMHEGVTYDFYVRGNCGGNTFSAWSGPYSFYAEQDYNIDVPCSKPTNLYAYRTGTTEINFTSVGHGSISYEVSISTSASTLTSNILTFSSPNGAVYNSGGYSGTRYFWIRGKCSNNSFTSWATSQVQ